MELALILILYTNDGENVEVCHEYTNGARGDFVKFTGRKDRKEATNYAYRTAVDKGVGIEVWWDSEKMSSPTPEEVQKEWYYVLAPKVEQKVVRLPKQWRHWCRKYGLRPEHMNRGGWAWFSLNGKGHKWRVNMYAEFECGESYERHDRWALSASMVCSLPQTEKEFRTAVLDLCLQQKLLRERKDLENAE